MITTQQLSDSLARECDIAVHLHSKLTPASYDYRPSPDQRSTTELLRYLAICASAGLKCMTEKNWKLFGDYQAQVKDMPPEEFPAAMQRQKEELAAFFASQTDERLRDGEALLPSQQTAPLAMAIIDGPLKWLAAYKLQLFHYAKATGASDIGTSNAWAGKDRA